jgi:hypothetical protein
MRFAFISQGQWSPRGAVAAGAAATVLLADAPSASAQTNAAGPKAPEGPARPEINWFYRYKEDWSVLADPALHTDPFDATKHIPLGSDPHSYLSLGVTIRERFESASLRLPPIIPDDHLIDRTQF